MPLIGLAVDTAALQLRHHQIDEGLEITREHRRYEIKAVAGSVFEPILHGIGNHRRRADQHHMAARCGKHCPFGIGQVRCFGAAGGLSAVTVSAQVRGGDREPPGEAGDDFVPHYVGLRMSMEQQQR